MAGPRQRRRLILGAGFAVLFPNLLLLQAEGAGQALSTWGQERPQQEQQAASRGAEGPRWSGRRGWGGALLHLWEPQSDCGRKGEVLTAPGKDPSASLRRNVTGAWWRGSGPHCTGGSTGGGLQVRAGSCGPFCGYGGPRAGNGLGPLQTVPSLTWRPQFSLLGLQVPCVHHGPPALPQQVVRPPVFLLPHLGMGQRSSRQDPAIPRQGHGPTPFWRSDKSRPGRGGGG